MFLVWWTLGTSFPFYVLVSFIVCLSPNSAFNSFNAHDIFDTLQFVCCRQATAFHKPQAPNNDIVARYSMLADYIERF